MSSNPYPSPSSGDYGPNPRGTPELDYIFMASGHSRQGPDALGLAPYEPPSRRSWFLRDPRTLSPNDSVSVHAHHAPGAYLSHGPPPRMPWHSHQHHHHHRHHRHHLPPSPHAPNSSHGEDHVPPEIIRSIASGAGSSFEASMALERYKDELQRICGAREGAMAPPGRTSHSHNHHNHHNHRGSTDSRPSHSHPHSRQNVLVSTSTASVTVTNAGTRRGHRTVVEIRDS